MLDTMWTHPRKAGTRLLALACICCTLCGAQSEFWRKQRSLAEISPPSQVNAAGDCGARGFQVSMWRAPSGPEAAAALRSSVGGAPDSQFSTQNLNFGLESSTGAGVPIAAQKWPAGYVGQPFISTFATYLRAPYDGVYRFYVTSDDQAVVGITDPKGLPVSVVQKYSGAELQPSLQTTVYETQLTSGHYVLSLTYAKTDVTLEPRVKLEWEYPEKASAAAPSAQPGRIIPRSMVYKRDAFLNKCSVPTTMAPSSAAVQGQMKGPVLPQPLGLNSAALAPQASAPRTAPSAMMAPSKEPSSSTSHVAPAPAGLLNVAATYQRGATPVGMEQASANVHVPQAAAAFPIRSQGAGVPAQAPSLLVQELPTQNAQLNVVYSRPVTASDSLPEAPAPAVGNVAQLNPVPAQMTGDASATMGLADTNSVSFPTVPVPAANMIHKTLPTRFPAVGTEDVSVSALGGFGESALSKVPALAPETIQRAFTNPQPSLIVEDSPAPTIEKAQVPILMFAPASAPTVEATAGPLLHRPLSSLTQDIPAAVPTKIWGPTLSNAPGPAPSVLQGAPSNTFPTLGTADTLSPLSALAEVRRPAFSAAPEPSLPLLPETLANPGTRTAVISASGVASSSLAALSHAPADSHAFIPDTYLNHNAALQTEPTATSPVSGPTASLSHSLGPAHYKLEPPLHNRDINVEKAFEPASAPDSDSVLASLLSPVHAQAWSHAPASKARSIALSGYTLQPAAPTNSPAPVPSPSAGDSADLGRAAAPEVSHILAAALSSTVPAPAPAHLLREPELASAIAAASPSVTHTAQNTRAELLSRTAAAPEIDVPVVPKSLSAPQVRPAETTKNYAAASPLPSTAAPALSTAAIAQANVHDLRAQGFPNSPALPGAAESPTLAPSLAAALGHPAKELLPSTAGVSVPTSGSVVGSQTAPAGQTEFVATVLEVAEVAAAAPSASATILLPSVGSDGVMDLPIAPLETFVAGETAVLDVSTANTKGPSLGGAAARAPVANSPQAPLQASSLPQGWAAFPTAMASVAGPTPSASQSTVLAGATDIGPPGGSPSPALGIPSYAVADSPFPATISAATNSAMAPFFQGDGTIKVLADIQGDGNGAAFQPGPALYIPVPTVAPAPQVETGFGQVYPSMADNNLVTSLPMAVDSRDPTQLSPPLTASNITSNFAGVYPLGDAHVSANFPAANSPAIDPVSQRIDSAAVDPSQQSAFGAAINPSYRRTDGATVDPSYLKIEGAAVDPSLQSTTGAAVDPSYRWTDGAAVDPSNQRPDGAAVNPSYRRTDSAVVDPSYRRTDGAFVDPLYRRTEAAAVDPSYRRTDGAAPTIDSKPIYDLTKTGASPAAMAPLGMPSMGTATVQLQGTLPMDMLSGAGTGATTYPFEDSVRVQTAAEGIPFALTPSGTWGLPSMLPAGMDGTAFPQGMTAAALPPAVDATMTSSVSGTGVAAVDPVTPVRGVAPSNSVQSGPQQGPDSVTVSVSQDVLALNMPVPSLQASANPLWTTLQPQPAVQAANMATASYPAAVAPASAGLLTESAVLQYGWAGAPMAPLPIGGTVQYGLGPYSADSPAGQPVLASVDSAALVDTANGAVQSELIYMTQQGPASGTTQVTEAVMDSSSYAPVQVPSSSQSVVVPMAKLPAQAVSQLATGRAPAASLPYPAGWSFNAAPVPAPGSAQAAAPASHPLHGHVRKVTAGTSSAKTTRPASPTGALDTGPRFLSLPDSFPAGLSDILPPPRRSGQTSDSDAKKSFLSMPGQRHKSQESKSSWTSSSGSTSTSFVSEAVDRLRLPSLPADFELPLPNPLTNLLPSTQDDSDDST
eukprot:jgi/Botrbrau1/2998/Bobra.0026s0056.1